MPGDERHQQLQHDRFDGGKADPRLSADAAHGQRDQRGRQHDADQVGKGRAAHGRGNIAARNGGEGDRGLYGRGQQRQEHHTRRNRTIPASATIPATRAHSPRAGSTLASTTVPSSMRMNGSTKLRIRRIMPAALKRVSLRHKR
ncbi:hypothetical protein WR25_22198 [Diploscapter pachys]|uniref:Uncharacterized protein n=1 Tax=Diploscapter pachys TaxID=2018661 RepID=A0A2A2KIR8_9BILA|nr:hypothetical protein WR25_22198 [Diploscapter pachys]